MLRQEIQIQFMDAVVFAVFGAVAMAGFIALIEPGPFVVKLIPGGLFLILGIGSFPLYYRRIMRRKHPVKG